MGTLQVGGTTLGVKNTVTNKVDLSNTGTLDNLPFFACRAWVNFDGTKDTSGSTSTANTNRLIRGSGNVASVLRNGTGDYTITFTTEMPDANYVCNITVEDNTNSTIMGPSIYTANLGGTNPSNSAVRLVTPNSAAGNGDKEYILVAIFR